MCSSCTLSLLFAYFVTSVFGVHFFDLFVDLGHGAWPIAWYLRFDACN